LPELETIITAGEACSTELVLKWGQERRFYNAYGPTETTVCASASLCQADGRRPAIGGPIANMQLYILDPLLRPLPIGVPGELYIGGIGLARGYLGRPDLTAERFVPHPFAQSPGERLYKTGDLVYWREDGQIEFLGRLDNQVKLRGFRIELGEIEMALEKCEEIKQSVVVAREDVPGDKRLVAYLMPDAGREIDLDGVQDYLRRKLPYYMIPAALVVMGALPLSPNGKVDLRKLPPPAPGRATGGTSTHLPPRDTLEMQLVQIYEELLQVRPVSILDDFFTLGGHSLLAVRLMSEIQKRLHMQVALSIIFQHSSIIALASILRRKEAVPQSPLVMLRSGGSQPPLFLVHPANGQVACYYRLASYLPVYLPCYGLQDLDIYQQDVPERSIEEMAAAYIKAIRAVQPEGPYYLGGYSFGGIVAFEMAQQLQEVALLAILDGAAPDSKDQKSQQPVELLATIVGEAVRKAGGQTIQNLYNEMQGLSFEQQLEYAMEALRAAKVDLLVMEKEWLREQVELFARRLRAVHCYHARPYAGRIVLFRATEIDSLDDESAEDQGWQRMSLLPLDIRPISGYHDTIINEPHVRDLAVQLKSLVV
jgi:thioesterase domain-containing protein